MFALISLLACFEPGTPSSEDTAGDTASQDDTGVKDTGTEDTGDPQAEAWQDTLLYMREEEKLARDVYDHLDGVVGGTPKVFGNIQSSEQSHMDVLGEHVDRLGLTDPVVDDTPGVFADPALAELYEQLTSAGEATVVDALIVGVTIEDLDILDLQSAIAESPDAELNASYEQIMCGSRNHLRAFVKNLDKQGGSYTPQYITQAEYDAILAADQEQCEG